MEKILFSEEKPKSSGYYYTNRGKLWFNPTEEHGLFHDEDGFPIYSSDKIKWWVKFGNYRYNQLKKAFEDGRKYEAGELDLDPIVKSSVFEEWFDRNFK